MNGEKKQSKFGKIFGGDGRSDSKMIVTRRESSDSGDEQDQLLSSIVEGRKSKSDKSLLSSPLRRKASQNDHDYAAIMEATALSAKHMSKGSSKSSKKLGSSLRGVSKKEALEQELEHLKAMSSLHDRINTQQTYITKLEMQVSKLDDRLCDLENVLNTEKQRSLIADTALSKQSCWGEWLT